jgi:hypothetical protein
MLILAVTPRAFSIGMSQPGQGLLLASIYLGGATIGLAYVCYRMTQGLSGRSGITRDQVERYAGLLVGLVVARAGVLLVVFIYTRPLAARFVGSYLHDTFYMVPSGGRRMEIFLLLGLVVLILPTLAFAARRATRSGSASQAASTLIGVCFGGIFAEIFSRLLLF